MKVVIGPRILRQMREKTRYECLFHVRGRLRRVRAERRATEDSVGEITFMYLEERTSNIEAIVIRLESTSCFQRAGEDENSGE